MLTMDTGAPTPSERPLADVVMLPAHGEVLPDARGGGRWVRVTWHQDADVVVLSLWREGTCVGTARVARDDVPVMVSALVSGLAGPPAHD
jgi:hypothetical protein